LKHARPEIVYRKYVIREEIMSLRFAEIAWTWLAQKKWAGRSIIKFGLFALLFLVITMPNPWLTVKQVVAYMDIEALLDPNFPEMKEINSAINVRLPQHSTFNEEYQTIVKFVYDSIRYEFDWDNWRNSEYWPSAKQVWQRKREDCDGQAILAASIFRSRGYSDATVVASLRHLWIRVGNHELMGPDKEKLMIVEKGKKHFLLPSFNYMLESFAGQLYYYPLSRMVLILCGSLLLLFHPHKSIILFLALLVAANFGLILIVDWSRSVSFYDDMRLTIGFLVGCFIILTSIVMAWRPQWRHILLRVHKPINSKTEIS
jgi:hypothetical protein